MDILRDIERDKLTFWDIMQDILQDILTFWDIVKTSCGAFCGTFSHFGSFWGHLAGHLVGHSHILGHLGDILGHLSPEACPGWFGSMSLGRFSPNFRANSGLKIVLSGMCFSIFVRPVFGHVFDNFGDDFGDHFGTKSAQEGAKTSPYVHQEFHRPNTLHLQKHKKLFVFLSLWGP